jgi:hypothetical protein
MSVFIWLPQRDEFDENERGIDHYIRCVEDGK